jgi:hypothetical protein
MSTTTNGGRIILSKTARKRRSFPQLNPHIPSLTEFLHQQKVKSQYRQFLRAIQQGFSEEEDRKDALQEVKFRYRQLQKEEDPLIIRMAFQEGQRQLSQLSSLPRPILSPLLDNPPNSQSITHDGDDSKNNSDSWINIKDHEDPRGRIGIQWPWEQTKNS